MNGTAIVHEARWPILESRVTCETGLGSSVVNPRFWAARAIKRTAPSLAISSRDCI